MRVKISTLDRWVSPRHVAWLGTVLTLLLFAVGYFTAWQGYRNQFMGDASHKATVIIDSLEGRLQDLAGVRRFMEVTGSFDRQQFYEITTMMATRPGIQTLAWVPVVTADRRAVVEQAGEPGFRITQMTPDGSLISAPPRPAYYPISFFGARQGGEQLIGFDEGSDPDRLAALQAAQRSGETRVTARIKLARGHGKEYGVLLFTPVRTSRGEVRGFVLGVVGEGDRLGTPLQTTVSLAIEATVDDLSPPMGAQRLHTSRVPAELAGKPPGLDDFLFPQLRYAREFRYAGRQWRISCAGSRGYHAESVSLAFVLILPLGLVITRLSFLALQRQALSHEEVELKVVTRTAQLALSRSHMQTMLDNLPMLAWLKDEEGRFLMVNNRFAEAVGRHRDEILGLTVYDVWPPHLASLYQADDREVLQRGLRKQMEEWQGDENGGGWFETFRSPITSLDGRVIGTTGIAQNITRRKQNEELILRHQRELETLNASLEARIVEEIARSRAKDLPAMQQEKLASIGQLAAGVAHEVNTPLGYIAGNIQVFKGYFNKMSSYLVAQDELLSRVTTDEQRQELAELAQRLDMEYVLSDTPDLIDESLHGAERVSQIVRDLRSFSRVDALLYEEVDLTVCLESALRVLSHELTDVAMVAREDRQMPFIYCQPGELNQVFLNLLRNAGQAVAPQGRITLKSWYDDRFISVAVTDDGHGIPEELRTQIFEPFFTTKEVGKGTGLGLSVCREIVTRHGGELLVESTVGGGSTFTVKLPRIENNDFPLHLLRCPA